MLKKMLTQTIAAVIITGLVIVDMWTVDKRYLNKDNFENKSEYDNNFVASPADELILKDKSLNYRVLNLQNPFTESRTSYFHSSLGGYSPAKVRRYQDLIENNLGQEVQMIIGALNQPNQTYDGINAAIQQQKVIGMLNTKYLLAGTEARAVIPNPYALGNAWFVAESKAVSSPDEELAALKTINPAQTAIFDKNKFSIKEASFDTTAAKIILTNSKPNRLEYESDNAHAGLALFSEIYYGAGWKVTLDGQEVSHFRANYILRAIEIPAGKHKIVFSFEPSSFTTGNKISLFASLAVILLVIGATVVSLRATPEKAKNNV